MESTEPARFIIASGPTRLRHRLANEMGRRFPEELSIKEYDLYYDDSYVNTDYRQALKNACDLATYKNENGKPTIFTHSLLDALTYATLAVERHAKFQNVSDYERDKGLLMFGIIGAMFRDSFSGEVLFIEIYDESDDQFEVQEHIRMILDEFEIGYTVFKSPGLYDDVERIIANTLKAK